MPHEFIILGILDRTESERESEWEVRRREGGKAQKRPCAKNKIIPSAGERVSNPATKRTTGNDCGRGLVSCRRTGNVIHVDKHPGGRSAEEKSRGKPGPIMIWTCLPPFAEREQRSAPLSPTAED